MNWTPLTAQDFMTIEYIIRLDAEFQAVAALRGELFGTMPAVTSLAFFARNGIAAPAELALFNTIERNIDVLAGDAPPEGMLPTRLWRGEFADDPFLDFSDVNRWFDSLRLIRGSLMGRGNDFKTTGTYAAGTNPIRQKIRLGGVAI